MAIWYKKRILAVLLLLSEIISFVLDKTGGSNRLFLVASFLLSAIGFLTTIYTSFFSSTVPAVTRSESERQLIAVEIVFSFIQLVFTCIQLIRIFLGVKSNNNESLLPLAFAVISVVFIFRNNEEAHDHFMTHEVVADSTPVSHIISIVDDESAILPESNNLRQRTTSTQSTRSSDQRSRAVGQKQPLLPPVELGKITEDDLKLYDGSDSKKPILMAIKGQIYDVSKSRMFYGPGGPYALFAGKDASRAIAKMSFEDKDLNGDISGLGPFEMEALQDWEYKFMSKYVKVGSIKKDVPVTDGESAETKGGGDAKPAEDGPSETTAAANDAAKEE